MIPELAIAVALLVPQAGVPVPQAGVPVPQGGVPVPQGGVTVDWTPCVLEDEDTEQRAECALVDLPFDHEAPDDRTFAVLVKRFRSGGDRQGPRRQLWFLSGGPGDSGVEALQRLVTLLSEDGLDIYTLDHRGVGGSALLACPAEQAEDSDEGREITAPEWPACIQYIRDNRSDLDVLTTSQSAHDVGALISATRGPDDRVFLFGASYGTYWANRFLQLYPTLVDGVILDGVVPPDWTFAEFDADLALAGNRLLAKCSGFAPCSEHLGPDPVATARALPAKFDAGHCSDLGADAHTVRLILGNMLMGGPDIWPYIAPTVHRLDRCWLRDMLAIGSLVDRVFNDGGAGEEPESHAQVLQRHVALSEIWPDPAPSRESLEAAAAGAMTTSVSVAFANTYESWPRYPRPERHGELPDYGGPLLMLHGELDPTLPPERLAGIREHYSGPAQTFVLFPDAGHVVIKESPCAQSLYRAFLTNPAADLDRSCVEEGTGLDLGALPADTDSAFGTNDLWGDRRSSLELWLIAGGASAVVGVFGLVTWVFRRVRRRRAA